VARFAYYERLSKAQKATYRRSDAVPELAVPDPTPLRRYAAQLEDALLRDDRVAVEQAAVRLASHLTILFEVNPVSVRVEAVRPRQPGVELHGLYEREEGRKPRIVVWMRTAARSNVVAFKTFLRTLAHELCHHLDFELFGFDDTFHTQGFFRRENHLVKQLLPRRGPLGRAAAGAVAAVPKTLPASVVPREEDGPARERPPAHQLELPWREPGTKGRTSGSPTTPERLESDPPIG